MYYINKIIGCVVSPIGLAIIGGAGALICARLKRQRVAKWLGWSALASAPDLLLRNGPSLSADPPDLAAKQEVDWSMMRMANEERIRVCAAPVADRQQVRGAAESLSSFAMSQKSFQVVAATPQ